MVMSAQLELLETGRPRPVTARGRAVSMETSRDEAMRAIIAHAGQRFRREAEEFVLAFLERNGETPGEFITDACKAAGIVPHDDRAFGPVYMALSRRGLIEKVASCQRRKGHGTNGGIVWRLA